MVGSDEDGANLRGAARQAVLKGAQIVFGQSVIDCLVLNISGTGARVRTGAVVQVPEQVTLRFRGGAVAIATRRWARGAEIGFSMDAAVSLAEEPARLAWRIYESIRHRPLDEPLRLLGERSFFDDVALRTAAEEAEAAWLRFEALLVARARASGQG